MSKTSKLTREEWLQLGAQSKFVRKVVSDYFFNLQNKINFSHPVTQRVQTVDKKLDEIRSTLDDTICLEATKLFDDKEILKVFYNEPLEEQKPYIKELMSKAAEKLHVEANTNAD